MNCSAVTINEQWNTTTTIQNYKYKKGDLLHAALMLVYFCCLVCWHLVYVFVCGCILYYIHDIIIAIHLQTQLSLSLYIYLLPFTLFAFPFVKSSSFFWAFLFSSFHKAYKVTLKELSEQWRLIVSIKRLHSIRFSFCTRIELPHIIQYIHW